MSHLTIRLKSPTDPAPSSPAVAKYLIKSDETTIHQDLDPSSTPVSQDCGDSSKDGSNQPKPAVVMRAAKRKLDELTEAFANTSVSEAEIETREEQDAKRFKGRNAAAYRDHANKRNEEIRASRNVCIEVMGVDTDGHSSSSATSKPKSKYDPVVELRDLSNKYAFKTEYKIELVSWKDGHMMEAVLVIKDGGFVFNGCPVFKKTIFGGKKRRARHRMNVAKKDVARQALVWYRENSPEGWTSTSAADAKLREDLKLAIKSARSNTSAGLQYVNYWKEQLDAIVLELIDEEKRLPFQLVSSFADESKKEAAKGKSTETEKPEIKKEAAKGKSTETEKPEIKKEAAKVKSEEAEKPNIIMEETGVLKLTIHYRERQLVLTSK